VLPDISSAKSLDTTNPFRANLTEGCTMLRHGKLPYVFWANSNPRNKAGKRIPASAKGPIDR